MREVVFKPAALKALIRLCDYVEAKNTAGSGYRFQEKILDFIESNALILSISYPLCFNAKLAVRGYSCFIFQKKWVIAFRITENKMIIYRIILGAKLK
jgi:plasmid stabilization system protein ParE